MKNLKKQFFTVALAALSLIIFNGCKKDSGTTSVAPPTPPPAATANSWKLGTTEFTSAYTFRFKGSGSSDSSLTGWDRVFTAGMDFNTINSWAITFKTFPTANSTYRVVLYPSSGSLTSNTDVYITAKSAGVGTAFVSTGVGAIDVTVTFNAGKATVVVPSIPMSNGTTTTTFSGTLKEM